MTKRMLLDGRVAIVTGGARGIGAAVAAQLIEKGMRVVLADVLPQVEDTARGLGKNASAFVGDISEPSEIARMIAEPERVFGQPARVAAWIAGITRDKRMVKVKDGKVTPYSIGDLSDVVRVNLMAPAISTILFIERLAQLGLIGTQPENEWLARIALAGSIMSGAVSPGQFAYSGTKAFIAALATGGNCDTKALGIFSTTYEFGFTRTPMVDKMSDAAKAGAAARVESGTIHEPEVVAAAVVDDIIHGRHDVVRFDRLREGPLINDRTLWMKLSHRTANAAKRLAA